MTNLIGEFTAKSAEPAKLKTGRIALFDADFIKYHVAAKIFKDIQKIERGELDIFIKEDPLIKYTKEIISGFLLKIDDPIIFCFSAPSIKTFRCGISFEKVYKGNRKKDNTDYPEKLQDMIFVMDYIIKNYVSLITDDLEADDIVAMLQDPYHTYILSKDKDLKQVPGYHYNFMNNTIELITPEIALYNLSKQLLMGDTTDNILGIRGIGEVAADKILKEVSNPKYYIRRVLHEYQIRFGAFKGTDMFTENWMLVKMRENRGTDFIQKHQRLFDTKQMLLNQIEKDKMK